jgi:hypothetical protein
MSVLEPTVTVDEVKGHSALRMLWQRDVDIEDVAVAFEMIVHHMNTVDAATHIVIDLLNCTRFPLLATIECALTGPAAHKNMGDWLVVGTSQLARVFAQTLINVTGRSNVHFLSDTDQLQEHLDHLAGEMAAIGMVTD